MQKLASFERKILTVRLGASLAEGETLFAFIQNVMGKLNKMKATMRKWQESIYPCVTFDLHFLQIPIQLQNNCSFISTQ